jgi:transposase-like protein
MPTWMRGSDRFLVGTVRIAAFLRVSRKTVQRWIKNSDFLVAPLPNGQ